MQEIEKDGMTLTAIVATICLVIAGLVGVYLVAHNYRPKYEPPKQVPIPSEEPHGDYPEWGEGKG